MISIFTRSVIRNQRYGTALLDKFGNDLAANTTKYVNAGFKIGSSAAVLANYHNMKYAFDRFSRE